MSLFGQSAILENWDFLDGTDLSNTSNTGSGSAAWSGVYLGSITNGSIRLPGDAKAASSATFATPYLPAASPVGIFRFEAVVTGWDLSPFVASADQRLRNFSVALRAENTPIGTGAHNIARFYVQYNEEAANLVVQTNNATTENLTTPALSGLGLVNTDTSYTFHADIDFNLGRVTFFLDGDEIGSRTGLAATDLASIVAQSFGPPAFVESDAYVDFGSVTLTAIPEPSTYAALFGLAALAVVAVRRRRQ